MNLVLFATGRAPNVKGLNLEAAGVEYDVKEGVHTNDKLETTNSNIFAVGDCSGKYQFTHNSDITARYVIKNALFLGGNKRSDILLPWCTYTEPEIAHVGKYCHELDKAGVKYDSYIKFYDKLDRALCDSQDGIIKIHTKKDSDEILGATIVGGAAGDMISQITQAMYNGLGMSKVGACVHPYPTYAESFRHLADRYNGKKLTSGAKTFLRKLIDFQK